MRVSVSLAHSHASYIEAHGLGCAHTSLFMMALRVTLSHSPALPGYYSAASDHSRLIARILSQSANTPPQFALTIPSATTTVRPRVKAKKWGSQIDCR